MTKKSLIAILFGIISSHSQTIYASDHTATLETVPQVDLQRYLGKWYEIAKFPNRFQKGCDCATAHYSIRDDGDIRVENQCARETEDHSLKSSIGKAWVVDPVTHAKLKVRFFWPFSGDYWIIDLGENYEYSVVSEPKRNYLWILSRSPEIPEMIYSGILERLREKGFDLTRVQKGRQIPDPACIPNAD